MRSRARLSLTVLASVLLLGVLSPAIPSATAAGGKCFGKKPKIVGTREKETLKGSKKKDVISGGGGADRIRSGANTDRVCGGGGKDKIKAGPGDDFLDGGSGKDKLNGGPGLDICINGEVLIGCEGDGPEPALHLNDGVDWGFEWDAAGDRPAAGDPVTLTARVGNGIVGAHGYTMTSVPPQPFLTGATTVLTFTDPDDGTANVPLPFEFPFFGVSYSNVFASTNGWAQFGEAAWDYFVDFSPTAAQVAEYFRGVFPFWGDLELETVTGDPSDVAGEVRLVVAGDGSAFALQWVDMASYDNDTPERDLQVVFYKDGRIRYDYPGPNPAGGDTDENEALVAFSGGNGPSTYTEIARDTFAVPTTSLLFTPLGVAALTAPAGTLTFELPADTTFVSASPGCSVTTAPTATTKGSVSCSVPALAWGGQTSFTVTAEIGTSNVAYDFSAQYVAGGLTVGDLEQLHLT